MTYLGLVETPDGSRSRLTPSEQRRQAALTFSGLGLVILGFVLRLTVSSGMGLASTTVGVLIILVNFVLVVRARRRSR